MIAETPRFAWSNGRFQVNIMTRTSRLTRSRTMKARHRNRQGMSLVEIMIAMVVFMILALGVTRAVIQSQQIAQNNIIRNTAYTIAQGYMEQIKSLALIEVLNAMDDPDGTPLPTMSISALAEDDIEELDPLFLDGPDRALSGRTDGSNFREILIDLQEDAEGDPREVTMDAWFDVDITDISNRSYSHAIIIRFEARLRGAGARVIAGELRGLRADVNRMGGS